MRNIRDFLPFVDPASTPHELDSARVEYISEVGPAPAHGSTIASLTGKPLQADTKA